jgi:hypothetical protein
MKMSSAFHAIAAQKSGLSLHPMTGVCVDAYVAAGEDWEL